MQPAAVTHAGLDGVAKTVSQIENGAHPALAFVGRDHLGLRLAGDTDGMRQGVGLARQQTIQVVLEPGQEAGIANQANLDHLRQPGRQFAVRQCFQCVGIDDDRARLIEGADHVLAERMVDTGLSAHRGIDLRQQRRGHLDKRHPALISRGRKPGHVADHPAAERNQGGLPIASRLEQGAVHPVEHLQGFVDFAVGQDHFDRIESPQQRTQHRQVQGGDCVIADNRHAAAGDVAREQFALGQQLPADVDRVAAFAQVKCQRVHAGPRIPSG